MEQANVPEKFKLEVDKLLKRNRDLFASEDKDLGRTDTVEMHINTGTHEPIERRQYHTQLKERKMVDSVVDEMMLVGVVERSNSLWGFPIALMKKKDVIFCVDFRGLNKIRKKYSHVALPVIDDILASLWSAKHFSKVQGTGRLNSMKMTKRKVHSLATVDCFNSM